MSIDALLQCRLYEFNIKYSRRDILAYITNSCRTTNYGSNFLFINVSLYD